MMRVAYSRLDLVKTPIHKCIDLTIYYVCSRLRLLNLVILILGTTLLSAEHGSAFGKNFEEHENALQCSLYDVKKTIFSPKSFAHLYIESSFLKVDQGTGSLPNFTLKNVIIAPCTAWNGWFDLKSKEVSFKGKTLRFEDPYVEIAGIFDLPLPEFSVAQEHPWRWVHLPSLGWSQGQFRTSIPFSIPLHDNSTFTPHLGWWKGLLVGSKLSLDEGVLDLGWSQGGWYINSDLARIATNKLNLNLWLMGQGSSSTLQNSALNTQWASRAVQERDELWAGTSFGWHGLDMKFILTHWKTYHEEMITASRAHLAWSSLSDTRYLHLKLTGLIAHTSSTEHRAQLSGRYEQLEWLGLARIRGEVQAQGQSFTSERQFKSNTQGWIWLIGGLGSQARSQASNHPHGLDLEVRSELLFSSNFKNYFKNYFKNQIQTWGSVAPSWAQLDIQTPTLGRFGVNFEWERVHVNAHEHDSFRYEIHLRLWGGFTQMNSQDHDFFKHSIQPLSFSQVHQKIDFEVISMNLDIELGQAQDVTWGSGAVRIGKEFYTTGRWLSHFAPLSAWGLADLHSFALQDDHHINTSIYAFELGYQGPWEVAVHYWSRQVALLTARWIEKCGCWGISMNAAWSERYGESLNLSLHLGGG